MLDNSTGHVLVQGDSDDQLVELANLQICTAKASTPDLHDKNSCFRVRKLLALVWCNDVLMAIVIFQLITPSMEYIFQAMTNHESTQWVNSLNVSESI